MIALVRKHGRMTVVNDFAKADEKLMHNENAVVDMDDLHFIDAIIDSYEIESLINVFSDIDEVKGQG